MQLPFDCLLQLGISEAGKLVADETSRTPVAQTFLGRNRVQLKSSQCIVIRSSSAPDLPDSCNHAS